MTESSEPTLSRLFQEILKSPERMDQVLEGSGAHATELRRRVAELQGLGLFNSRGVESPGAIGERIVEPHIRPGDTLLDGRFTVESPLGRGGMGTVYRARDNTLRRVVAIKVARSGPMQRQTSLLRDVQRFVRESRIHGRLEHPNIAPVHELAVSTTGELLLVMRLVDGLTLEELQRRRGRPGEPRECLQWVVEASRALSEAHDLGIVHRDLKPSNIMIGPRGEVQVIDWGVAKYLAEEGENDVESPTEVRDDFSTADGVVVGTPSFMSPEQASGRSEQIGVRTDVYGLGAVLSFALTGKPIHIGDGYQECMAAARKADLSSTAQAWTEVGVPTEVVQILRRSLAASPGDRYADVESMRRDIEAFLDFRPGSAWSDSLLQRSKKLIRRHPAITVFAAALLIIACTGARAIWLGKEAGRGRELQAIVALSGRVRGALALTPPAHVLLYDGTPFLPLDGVLDLETLNRAPQEQKLSGWETINEALEELVNAFEGDTVQTAGRGFSLVDPRGRARLISALEKNGQGAQDCAQLLAKACFEIQYLLGLLSQRRPEYADKIEAASNEVVRCVQERFSLNLELPSSSDSSESLTIRMGAVLRLASEDFSADGSSAKTEVDARAQENWIEVTTRSGSALSTLFHPDWQLPLGRYNDETTVEVVAVCQRRQGGFGQGQGFRIALMVKGKCYSFPTRTVTGAKAGEVVASTGPVRIGDLRQVDLRTLWKTMGKGGLDAGLSGGSLLPLSELAQPHSFGVLISNHVSGIVRFRYEDMMVRFCGLKEAR